MGVRDAETRVKPVCSSGPGMMSTMHGPAVAAATITRAFAKPLRSRFACRR